MKTWENNLTTFDPFYRNGRIYDIMHQELIADSHFYFKEALRIGGPALEIACGTGRITIPIAKAGIEIVGLELSESMLIEARKKSNLEKIKIDWIHADCRQFNLNKKFKFIFIPFNSMQHLHDIASLEAFFENVKRHLLPDGIFILDIFNPSIKLLASDRMKRTQVMDLIDPETGLKATIEETIDYDVAVQINRVKWFYSLENKKDYKIDELNMRCFFPQEIDAIIGYNGFNIISKFGNFDRSEFSSSSPKQIMILQRKED